MSDLVSETERGRITPLATPMAYIAKRVFVRPLAISLVLATILDFGLPSLRGNAK